jgi:hypothetical protein
LALIATLPAHHGKPPPPKLSEDGITVRQNHEPFFNGIGQKEKSKASEEPDASNMARGTRPMPWRGENGISRSYCHEENCKKLVATRSNA